MSIKQALIEAIKDDPRSRAQIARDAKIGEVTIYKLIGGGNVTVDVADRLSATLGMTFRVQTKAEKELLRERRVKVSRQIRG